MPGPGGAGTRGTAPAPAIPVKSRRDENLPSSSAAILARRCPWRTWLLYKPLLRQAVAAKHEASSPAAREPA
jgi:hypothetical protein